MLDPSRALAEERERWVLWGPALLGVGIAVYFALPFEPPIWFGALTLIAVAALAWWSGRDRPVLFLGLLAVGAVVLGFSVSQWRTASVASPMLQARHGPATVTGRVVELEILPDGARVTLDRLQVSGLNPSRIPETIRVRLRARKQEAALPGDWLRMRAILTPPPAPSAPGAFDFQRQAYFERLGAVGFAMGPALVVARAEEDPAGGRALFLALTRLRAAITKRILAALPGDPGAVTAALMTGERTAISATAMTAIRESGLAHLLAISGLHIGLAAGIVLVSARAGLALIPALVLRYPIKKWAAVVALIGALAYALVAGATVPSLRSFLMLALVLLAVLVDRRGVSMRLVAWAATAILLVRPEALLGPSFQLSFAAVTALVAAYEAARERGFLSPSETPAWWHRAPRYVAGVALSTTVAGAATAPFGLYHFNQVAVYGLAANLIAVPVTALWVMPWAVGAFLLMPLGLEHLALVPMGWGVEVILAVARTVAGWPGAVTLTPALPSWALALVVVGGLWLCLWRAAWRGWGLAGVAAGVLALAVVRGPDILIDGEGKLMAVRTAEGRLMMSSLRTARFARDTWLDREGQEVAAPGWPREGFSPDRRLSCDALGCIYRLEGFTVALASRGDALDEDCRVADVVISAEPVRGRCPSARLVVDRFDLWREGAHMVWLDKDTVRVRSVNGERGRRPWVLRPKREPGRGH